MQNMLMGRYIPGDSIIHRMDPRSKLLVMIAFVVIIFLAHDWLGYLLLVLYTLAGVLLSKISVSYFLKGLRPMIGLILFTVIFKCFLPTVNMSFLAYGLSRFRQNL